MQSKRLIIQTTVASEDDFSSHALLDEYVHAQLFEPTTPTAVLI